MLLSKLSSDRSYSYPDDMKHRAWSICAMRSQCNVFQMVLPHMASFWSLIWWSAFVLSEDPEVVVTEEESEIFRTLDDRPDVDLAEFVANISARSPWFQYAGNMTLECADVSSKKVRDKSFCTLNRNHVSTFLNIYYHPSEHISIFQRIFLPYTCIVGPTFHILINYRIYPGSLRKT